jgi:hypothetical protein
MERFPQDLPLREMCTAEASFHPELRSVNPKQVLRALVELVDRVGGCLARLLGRLTETNLIRICSVYVNHGDSGSHRGAGLHSPRSPVAALGSGVNAPWQIGVNAPFRPNGFSVYSMLHDERGLQNCAGRIPALVPQGPEGLCAKVAPSFR